MGYYFPQNINKNSRVMFFIDGENLAIRYGDMLQGQPPASHVVYEPNVFVWSRFANAQHHICEVVRRHYYTAVQGDDLKLTDVADRLKDLGIEAPRIFKKAKGKGSKRVDISLATDMLVHAHRRNYDLAVLVAGDEDYVPLVEAVMAEGRRVALWFLENGLSPSLRRCADHYYDLKEILFGDERILRGTIGG